MIEHLHPCVAPWALAAITPLSISLVAAIVQTMQGAVDPRLPWLMMAGAMISISGGFGLTKLRTRAFARALAELPEDEMVTQWVHPDYDFRATTGAGAGQIRPESRLGLYYNLEDDRAGIRRKITRMLDVATRRENPWRDNEHRVVNVGSHDEEIAIGELARRMVEVSGRDVQVVPSADVPGSVTRRRPDITVMAGLLGEHQYTSLMEGLEECWVWQERTGWIA